MISFGDRAESQCETEEPDSEGFGAYICARPPVPTPEERTLEATAVTAGPFQRRFDVFVIDASRSASVILGHALADVAS